MPCRDGGPSAEEYCNRLDRITDMLCRLCAAVENMQGGTLRIQHTDIMIWWKKHKIQDLARIQEEQEREQREFDKQQKLQERKDLIKKLKLSKKEIDLLGIK